MNDRESIKAFELDKAFSGGIGGAAVPGAGTRHRRPQSDRPHGQEGREKFQLALR